MICIFFARSRKESRVNRDEGSRQNAFAEQVLKEIRNPQCRPKRVRCWQCAQKMGQGAFPNQPGNPAEHDSACHQDGWPGREMICPGLVGFRWLLQHCDAPESSFVPDGPASANPPDDAMEM